jgi:hypothetical protein
MESRKKLVMFGACLFLQREDFFAVRSRPGMLRIARRASGRHFIEAKHRAPAAGAKWEEVIAATELQRLLAEPNVVEGIGRPVIAHRRFPETNPGSSEVFQTRA